MNQQQNVQAHTAAIHTPHPPIILVLGGPGSGKGTQCKLLAHEFGLTHLSTGDLLRRQVAAGSITGLKVADLLARGELVSDDIVVQVLCDAIKGLSILRHKPVLVDGFPRTVQQAGLFVQSIGVPLLVLDFEAPLDVLRNRLMGRGRLDDNPRAIETRLKVHEETYGSVVGFFEELERSRVVKIPVTSPTDIVYSMLRPHFATPVASVFPPSLPHITIPASSPTVQSPYYRPLPARPPTYDTNRFPQRLIPRTIGGGGLRWRMGQFLAAPVLVGLGAMVLSQTTRMGSRRMLGGFGRRVLI